MSSGPLKVLFLASSYPRSRDDTASVFLRYLAEHLADCAVDVHVLAPAAGKGETVVEGKVTVHRFQYFPATLQGLAYGSGDAAESQARTRALAASAILFNSDDVLASASANHATLRHDPRSLDPASRHGRTRGGPTL